MQEYITRLKRLAYEKPLTDLNHISIKMGRSEDFVREARVRYLERALKDCPDGGICGNCKGPNTHVDDIGFFADESGWKALCENCAPALHGER